MDKKTICVSFYGTRPEAIKLFPLIKLLNLSPSIKHFSCSTGQHLELLDDVHQALEFAPDFDLRAVDAATNLTDLVATIISKTAELLNKLKPDLVLVHGDTATTLAVSIAAHLLKIPIGHVEAGLRTRNYNSPWPEEGNRHSIAALVKYHFAPTEKARKNLIDEKICSSNIIVTGNTAIDTLHHVVSMNDANHKYTQQQQEKYAILKSQQKKILVTSHRRENFGSGLKNICDALVSIAASDPSIQIIFPVHLNPNVKSVVMEKLSGFHNILLIEPVGYREFVYLMNVCDLILTDSGGIQEEAPSLNKPVLIMRDTTERPEAISSGTAKLVGTNASDIVQSTQTLLRDPTEYENMAMSKNPFGDGNASDRIVNFILEKHSRK